jgi:hypothetical protein
MTFDELLERFRALGGVATNVELREGKYGRGLFPVNPALPVRIMAPENLLMPVEWISLDGEGQIVLDENCDWPEQARQFYEEYQRQFSWGVVKDDIVRLQQAFIALPEDIKQALAALGVPNEAYVQPDGNWSLNKFINTRSILYAGKKVLMPVVELINFDAQARNFELDRGIGVTGVFDEEVLAHYGMGDTFGILIDYGFVAPTGVVNCCPLDLESPDGGKFIVTEDFAQIEKRGKFDVPKVTRQEGAIKLSFLRIGDEKNPKLPRWIFLNLMQEIGMQQAVAGELFDHIARLNRLGYLRLLMALEGRQGGMMEELRRMAYHQLTAMA